MSSEEFASIRSFLNADEIRYLGLLLHDHVGGPNLSERHHGYQANGYDGDNGSHGDCDNVLRPSKAIKCTLAASQAIIMVMLEI